MDRRWTHLDGRQMVRVIEEQGREARKWERALGWAAMGVAALAAGVIVFKLLRMLMGIEG